MLPPKHYYYYTHVRKYEELAIRGCVAGRPKYDNLGKCVTKRNVTRCFWQKDLQKMPRSAIFNSKCTLWEHFWEHQNYQTSTGLPDLDLDIPKNHRFWRFWLILSKKKIWNIWWQCWNTIKSHSWTIISVPEIYLRRF